jgi:DNA-directed RNA polymerase subunit K/omega
MAHFESEVYYDSNDFYENYNEYKKGNLTSRKLTLYEKTAIIGYRATQISLGSPALITVPDYMDDVVEIATLELKQKKCPFIIKRTMDNRIDYWKIEDILL